MIHLLRLVFVMGLLSLNAPAADPTSPPAADGAWEKWEEAISDPYPDTIGWTMRQHREWSEARAQRLRSHGVLFLDAFPADPRRWSVAWQLIKNPPSFVIAYGPNADADYDDVQVDVSAASVWKSKLADLERALRAAPDLPIDVREAIDLQRLRERMYAISRAPSPENGDREVEITKEVMAFADRYPDGLSARDVARGVMLAFEANHPTADAALRWTAFARSENRAIAELARQKLGALSEIGEPIDLKFTAVDGREVDLQKLRGKVVLIDFWATWCAPCMVEMPTVKKLYAAYHDQGFEVIGISCDVAPAAGSTSKTAKTAAQLIDFKVKNEMPWPDYYDGKKHYDGGNAITTRFAVIGIPHSFLIDQRGHIVARNLHGEKLEAEVKRLMALTNH